MTPLTGINRRKFLETGAAASTAFGLAGTAMAAETSITRVGVIGCGNVSHKYLAHLSDCPHATLVSTCDIIPERAKAQADKFRVPNHYPNMEQMLHGAPFDLLVNLTDMQEHEQLNHQGIAAGRNVWSEKPLANSLASGQALLETAKNKGLRIWAAPVVVASPQFAFMAETLAAGKLGRLAAAHGSYGHGGPNWSPFFFEPGGGSLPDLAVYQLTTLTGLLGPAQSVVAMTSVVTPTREIENQGEIRVTAEDNAMVLMYHGNGVISHVQSGFSYFSPKGHFSGEEEYHTVKIVGTNGTIGLVGYDWEPHGVDLATTSARELQRFATDQHDYAWEMGASLAAKCLATGSEMLIAPEHALHVLEVIEATRESQATGRRISLRSSFKWPVVA